ncbi:DUF2782 domain-containing protein [Permianibacter sp. IMCC34836]|uniref:DUF2782 domain-containing protein n=1 Tax=Permianibacter fluminis TaxID=2738515 RepID=UPI001555026D|nr:DUF2782 domain-containing protein [Permianibacter fluminis]NQD36088.1 DUF2782 domain-containing protein [Permianibacter fluminis]
MRTMLAVLAVTVAAIATAGEPVQDRPVVSQGNTLEPTVRVRPDDGATIKEWVKNGKLVAVRVEPKIGPAYYLVDTNGDGLFEPGPDFGDDGMVAQWVLFRF